MCVCVCGGAPCICTLTLHSSSIFLPPFHPVRATVSHRPARPSSQGEEREGSGPVSIFSSPGRPPNLPPSPHPSPASAGCQKGTDQKRMEGTLRRLPFQERPRPRPRARQRQRCPQASSVSRHSRPTDTDFGACFCPPPAPCCGKGGVEGKSYFEGTAPRPSSCMVRSASFQVGRLAGRFSGREGRGQRAEGTLGVSLPTTRCSIPGFRFLMIPRPRPARLPGTPSFSATVRP